MCVPGDLLLVFIACFFATYTSWAEVAVKSNFPSGMTEEFWSWLKLIVGGRVSAARLEYVLKNCRQSHKPQCKPQSCVSSFLSPPLQWHQEWFDWRSPGSEKLSINLQHWHRGGSPEWPIKFQMSRVPPPCPPRPLCLGRPCKQWT